MTFIEQDSRNDVPSSVGAGKKDANVFAFFDKPTPENLAANHSGILSPQQKKALEEIVASAKVGFVAFGSMSVVSVAFISFLFWKIDSADGSVSFTAQLINGIVMSLVFLVFMGFVTRDLFVLLAGDDLTNAVVDSALGKIEWSGKRYRMQTDSRLLRSLRSRVALPPPGQYRFYYLPKTGLVVMAERVGDIDAHHVPPLLLALAGANGFSLEDLKVNQGGLLSKRQENGLLLLAVLYLLICLSIAALFTVLIPQIQQSVSSTQYVLILIIAAILFLRFSWSFIRMIADIWTGKSSHVEGWVVRQTHRSRYSRSYYYVSGTHKFQVSEAAYHALIEGSLYRIYYVPYSKRLVSIEPL